ncbi:hypothetical protein Tsubulata_030209, partial [Turnera subulata]
MIVNVPNLQELFLQSNNLTGNILRKCTLSLRDLQVLSLQKNFLSNDPSNPELNLFTSLANYRALKMLYLDNNLFSGILPQSGKQFEWSYSNNCGQDGKSSTYGKFFKQDQWLDS